jgi:hypothetical protein
MAKIKRVKDKLYMPPLKKYEVYDRFPWKLIIQLLLMIFTSCQAFFVVNQSTSYAYSQYFQWNNLFLGLGQAQGSSNTITNSYNIFDIQSLQGFIQYTVSSYYNINSLTIPDYDYYYQNDGTRVPPLLLVNYFNNKKAVDDGYAFSYNLTEIDLGPISSPDVQTFLQQVKNFEIRFFLIHYVEDFLRLESNCYEWEIIQTYDNSYRGTILVELNTLRKICGESNCKL